jgi:hypothetical protein
MLKIGLLGVLVALGSVPSSLQGQQQQANQTYVIDYYYKARWGFADEFIRLFRKNHYPVLKKEIERGRIVSVTAVTPRYHATEDGRWDYRVTIVFRDAAAAAAPPLGEAEMRALFPDQELFRKEEQRRFEILLAHWDVPIAPLTLEQP